MNDLIMDGVWDDVEDISEQLCKCSFAGGPSSEPGDYDGPSPSLKTTLPFSHLMLNREQDRRLQRFGRKLRRRWCKFLSKFFQLQRRRMLQGWKGLQRQR